MTVKLHLIGVESGLGAKHVECCFGPKQLRESPLFDQYLSREFYEWHAVIAQASVASDRTRTESIHKTLSQLAAQTALCVQQGKKFVVLGGDHSCAMGTWSGASAALSSPLGLIWIDAHMDAHTFETTPSGNIHGMPLAHLLGRGDTLFSQLQHPNTKIAPEHLVLIGVRSYEPEERDLLQSLGVRVYEIAEVRARGFAAVFCEAHQMVMKHCKHFAVSLDIDAMDPNDAPGTGAPELNGIAASDIIEMFNWIDCSHCIGIEIAEFDPSRDIAHKTEHVILQCVQKFSRALHVRPVR